MIGWVKTEGTEDSSYQYSRNFSPGRIIEVQIMIKMEIMIFFTESGFQWIGLLNDGSENFAFQEHSYELVEPEEVASSIALDTDADNDADIVQATEIRKISPFT